MKQLVFAVSVLAMTTVAPAQAQIFGLEAPRPTAVGSWFGRAVVDNPWCNPGEQLDPNDPEAGICPIPSEIVMLPTFFEDGNFMAIDSNVFLGDHTEAHGEWKSPEPGKIEANWVFLQSDETGRFAGAFRMRMQAEVVDQNNAIGSINAFFVPFTDENGSVILDEAGNPVPDPLADVGPYLEDGTQCAPPLNGCFGVFTFTVRRVQVP